MNVNEVKIGMLVICGTEEYIYTNNKSLCIVKNICNNTMINVKIIASADHRSFSDYSVNISEFNAITLDEYFELFPDATKCSDFYDVISKYGIIDTSTKNEVSNVFEKYNDESFVLPEEQRKELVEEMITLLKEYNYSPTVEGCNAIIDEWVENKGKLIKMMQKHPNYNGKFQIVYDTDITRSTDKQIIEDFCNYLANGVDKEIYNMFHKEITIDGKTVIDAKKMLFQKNKICNIFDEIDFIPSINGMNKEEWNKVREEEKMFYLSFKEKGYVEEIFGIVHHCYDKDLVDKYNVLIEVTAIFENCFDQWLNEETANKLNDLVPELKAVKGQKTSRVMNKFCTLFGINKAKEFNKRFAEYGDAINPINIKRHTVFSVHPVDYFTMSFGNTWSSCHTIDKGNVRNMENSYHGQYSGGTLSYMLDGTSAVFYLVNNEYNGNQLELQPKINRNMFHIGEDKIIQGRIYPQYNDSESSLYTQFRNIVQKIVADCFEVPNMWKLKKGTSACHGYTITKGVHYKDYLCFNDCNVSLLKNEEKVINHNRITIGHNPICPNCGKKHSEEQTIECYYCYDDEAYE